MERIWIKEQGDVNEAGLREQILKYIDASRFVVAYFTDRFVLEHAGEEVINGLDIGKLLELRLFDQEMELLVRRSSVGTEFHWRLADDQYMREVFLHKASDLQAGLPDQVELLYIDGRQKIDYNPERSKDAGDKICVMSTVGGCYTVPSGIPMEYIAVRTYYSYAEDGMAVAADFRLRGFEN